MTNKTRKWVRAGAEAFITGFTAGPAASIGATFIDPKDYGPSLKSLELFLWTAFISGGVRFWHWWSTNPLPPEDDSVPPILGAATTPVMPMSPLAKVTPLVPQPTVEPPVEKKG